jgi:hypothetical protein
MTYIDTEAKRKRLQQALLDHGFDIGPDGVDGDLGGDTARAIINARIAHKLDHQDRAVVDTDLMRELGLLTIQDPVVTGIAKSHGIDLFTLIGLIGPVSAILKGRKMTADQITGILRAILTAVGGYLVGKGIVDQATATEIIGAVVTIGGALWSIYSNRPKVIVPLSAK